MDNNNVILNRIFTKSTFTKMINNEESCYYNIVNRYLKNIKKNNNGVLINEIYKYMGGEYRNEYYFKNTLINKLLLGKYSLNTTIALTEVPINRSKADLITINNQAIVYEIKTNLDNFERLDNQIYDYYKAFTYVCVVTSEKNYTKVYEILKDTNVGIYILTNQNVMSIRKKPIEERSYLDYEVIFKILRKSEFESIILDYYGQLPSTTPAFYYSECFELLKSIDINVFYKYMIAELKKRIYIEKENYKKYVPYELKFLIYFLDYKESDYVKLRKFLAKGFEG